VQGAGWPWLVAEDGGAVVGYAYAAQFRDRAAYAQTCESTIYVATDRHGQGIGRALMLALFDAARAADFHEMIAVVGDSGNLASIALHERLGFRRAGTLTGVGRKFGRLLDVVYLQRSLR
jgi:phosphinothricin acetyltransferase